MAAVGLMHTLEAVLAGGVCVARSVARPPAGGPAWARRRSALPRSVLHSPASSPHLLVHQISHVVEVGNGPQKASSATSDSSARRRPRRAPQPRSQPVGQGLRRRALQRSQHCPGLPRWLRLGGNWQASKRGGSQTADADGRTQGTGGSVGGWPGAATCASFGAHIRALQRAPIWVKSTGLRLGCPARQRARGTERQMMGLIRSGARAHA